MIRSRFANVANLDETFTPPDFSAERSVCAAAAADPKRATLPWGSEGEGLAPALRCHCRNLIEIRQQGPHDTAIAAVISLSLKCLIIANVISDVYRGGPCNYQVLRSSN